MLPVQADCLLCMVSIYNQSSSEFKVYAGNMNFCDLASIMNVEILIYAYRNIL